MSPRPVQDPPLSSSLHPAHAARSAYFEAFFARAPLGVYLVGADFRVCEANPIARATFGDIPDLHQRDFSEVLRIIWPADYAEEVIGLFRHTLHSGESYHSPEIVLQRRDGAGVGSYEWEIHRLDLPDAERAVICYFRDISSRVQERREIGETAAAHGRLQRLYETILSNTPDLAYVFDLQHRFIYANEVLLRMWGKTWDEAIGKNCLELGYPQWHAEMHDREIEQVIATRKPIRGEVPFTGTFGRRIYDYIFVPVINAQGEVEAVAGTTRDITERKSTEEAMRSSEHRYRSLFESIDEGFCVIEMIFDEHERPIDYLFVEVNPAFERQAGMHGATGKRMLEFVSHIEPHWLENYGRVATTGEPIRFADEYKSLHAWFDVYAFRVGDPAQRRVAVIFNNITQRKLAEQAVQRSQAELAAANAQLEKHARELDQLVAQRTEQLQDTVQQLETFSYSIVHDMRAPLRSMRAFAQVLIEEYSQGLDDIARGYLQRIMNSASRMDTLITDVLNYSRVTTGPADLLPVHLDKLVPEILEQYPQFQENAAAIAVERPLPVVLGNPALLTQVFSNLLGNALKFMPAGRAPKVRVHSEIRGDRIRLWVEDNGIGISAEQQARIFGLFERLHAAHEYAGTGVGLAVVKRAVEKMGGTVGVESEPDRGSRFWLELRPPDQPPPPAT